MLRWFALFILLPIAELGLLIEIGRLVGTLPTLALIFVTGVLGAALARQQGFRVLADVQREMGEGRIPAGALVDGLLVLVAAAVLLTPGVITDAIGFACLVPASRRGIRRWLLRWLGRAVEQRRVHVRGAVRDERGTWTFETPPEGPAVPPRPTSAPPPIDVEARPVEPDRKDLP